VSEAELRPPVHRMAIAVFALCGLLIATYMLLYKLRVIGSVACGSGSCETVQASPWAVFLGIPVPAWGVGGYLFILVLAFLGLQPKFSENKTIPALLLGSATFAFGFSVYLSAVEAFLIHAWCRWCIGSAVVATLIFLSALPEISALRRKHYVEA